MCVCILEMTDLKFSEKTVLYWWNQQQDEKGFLLFLWWITWKPCHPCAQYMRLKAPLTVHLQGPGKGRFGHIGISVIAPGPLPPTCLPSPPRPRRSRDRLDSPPVRTPLTETCSAVLDHRRHRERSICCIAESEGLRISPCFPFVVFFCNYFIWERRSRVPAFVLGGGGPAQQSLEAA